MLYVLIYWEDFGSGSFSRASRISLYIQKGSFALAASPGLLASYFLYNLFLIFGLGGVVLVNEMGVEVLF